MWQRKKQKAKPKNEQVAGLEALLAAQREHLSTLKEEVRLLRAEAERRRQREDKIGDALVLAKQKASELEEEARVRFLLECERLDDYRQSWQTHLFDLESAEELGQTVLKTDRRLKEIAEEMHEYIDADLKALSPPQEDFLHEMERMAGMERMEAIRQTSPAKAERCNTLSDDELKDLLTQLLKKDER